MSICTGDDKIGLPLFFFFFHSFGWCSLLGDSRLTIFRLVAIIRIRDTIRRLCIGFRACASPPRAPTLGIGIGSRVCFGCGLRCRPLARNFLRQFEFRSRTSFDRTLHRSRLVLLVQPSGQLISVVTSLSFAGIAIGVSEGFSSAFPTQENSEKITIVSKT